MPHTVEFPLSTGSVNEQRRNKFVKEIRQLSEDTIFPSGYTPVVFDIADTDTWEYRLEGTIRDTLIKHYHSYKPVHVILAREDYDEEDATNLLRQVFVFDNVQESYAQTETEEEGDEEGEKIWDLINISGFLINACSSSDLEKIEKQLRSINSPDTETVAKFREEVRRLDKYLTDLYCHNHPAQITSSVRSFFFPNDPFSKDELEPA